MTYRIIEIDGKRYLPNTFDSYTPGQYCGNCAFTHRRGKWNSDRCSDVNSYVNNGQMCHGDDKVNYQPESPETIANYTAALLTGRLEHGQK